MKKKPWAWLIVILFFSVIGIAMVPHSVGASDQQLSERNLWRFELDNDTGRY